MIKRYEEAYGELLDQAMEAAFLTSPDGTVLYANPAACRLFGYSLAEFQTLGRAAILDPSDPALIEALKIRKETGKFAGVLKMKRKDGTVLTTEVTSAVFTDINGELRTSTFIKDMTEWELREEELRVANENLTKALAEVRQLQGILPICSYCHRIRNDEQYWEKVESYITRHSEAQFSHSICPPCFEKEIRPQLDKFKD